MRTRNLLLASLLVAGVFFVGAPDVTASNACVLPVTNVCQGWSQVSTKTGGVLGTDERCFSLKTVQTAPACTTTTSNLAWEFDAGACITFYYYDIANGATAPAAPNKVSLTVREADVNLDVKVYLASGAEPANGASFSFCSTPNGNGGGAARAGTYYIYARIVKDNGPAGVGNYDIDTKGAAVVGAISTRDLGVLRSLQHVSAVSRSAYPAGTTFAYGTAGNEQVTVTATFDAPNEDHATDITTNTVKTGVVTYNGGALGAQGISGTAVDIDVGQTSLAQAVTVDATNTPFVNSPYVGIYTIVGNAATTGLPWTGIATTGNGANVVRFSATQAYDSTTFNIDPRIKLDSDGTHTFAGADETDVSKITNSAGAVTELFNKGETVYHEWFVLNSRGEKLSRAMTFAREDAANTQCASYGSLTPTSNKYSTTTALGTGATCLAAADTTGSARKVHVTNTGQDYRSGTVFFVSSLLRFDQDGTGSPDNIFKTCFGAGGCPGTRVTLFNRGFERVDCEGYVIDARGGHYTGSSLQFKSFDSSNAQLNSQTISSVADLYSCTDFQLTSTEKATADTTGDPHYFTVANNGNTGTSVSNDYSVSSLLFTDAHTELSASLVKDDYPTENAAEDTTYRIQPGPGVADASETVHLWCHVKNVRKDQDVDTSGSAVTYSLVDPTGATRLSGTADTGSDGWTTTHLDQLANTPLGQWGGKCDINFSGNTATNTQAFTVMVPATAGGGFPGDPIRAFAGPELPAPGMTVRIAITESLLDGTARTGNAAGTLVYVYDPSMNLVVNGAAATEVIYGGYRYDYTLASNAAAGPWQFVIRTTDPATGMPVGGSNVFTVASPTAFPTSFDLGGTATSSMVNTSIYTFVLAAILAAGAALVTSSNSTVRNLGAPVAALAGFLALTVGSGLVWRVPFAILAFGITAWGYLSPVWENRNRKNNILESDL